MRNLSKLNTLLNSANILETLQRSHNKTFFKVSKILAEFNKIFTFEKFVIYVLHVLKAYMHLLLFVVRSRKSDPKCSQ